MADIGKAVHTKLQATAAVTAICSSRGRPDALHQGETLPAYTYRKITGTSFTKLSSTSLVGLAEARVQVDCYADTAAAAEALRNEVRLVMIPFRGTSSSVVIRGCESGGEYDRYEVPQDGKSLGRYIRTIDLLLVYQEATS